MKSPAKIGCRPLSRQLQLAAASYRRALQCFVEPTQTQFAAGMMQMELRNPCNDATACFLGVSCASAKVAIDLDVGQLFLPSDRHNLTWLCARDLCKILLETLKTIDRSSALGAGVEAALRLAPHLAAYGDVRLPRAAGIAALRMVGDVLAATITVRICGPNVLCGSARARVARCRA